MPNRFFAMFEQLRKAILAYTDCLPPSAYSVYSTALANLRLFRSNGATPLQRAFCGPALVVVVQGAKDVLFGGERYRYAAGEYLIMSVGLPVRSSISDASAEKPYLALSLDIDLSVINELMGEIGRGVEPTPTGSRTAFGAKLLDSRQTRCLEGLAELLAMPYALRVPYPAIVREILFWLLIGPDGEQLRRLAMTGSHMQRVAEAIVMMRSSYADGISVERLAGIAGMSPSSFHLHFKALTSMSPLQYLKQMRLLEGRRLMYLSAAGVADVAHRVGYESSSQFSREYVRMFGVPPHRDAQESRQKA